MQSKRDVLWFIGSLESNSTDENVISLEKVISFLSLFQDRQTDILAQRDAIFNQNVRPMVHCFKGKFDAKKIKVLIREMRKRYAV